MPYRRHRLVLLFVAAVLVMGGGCDNFRKTPTSVPPPIIPEDVVAARDATLTFLRENYAEVAPPAGLQWSGVRTSATLAGFASYEFTSGAWVMRVWVPTLAQDEVLYEIVLDNEPQGMKWTGRLDGSFGVLEFNLNVDVDVLVVRELVLGYYRDSRADSAPRGELVWLGERVTPEGSIGHEQVEFTSTGWRMQVDYDAGRPDQVSYTVALQNTMSGVEWWCEVTPEGRILEIQRPTT